MGRLDNKVAIITGGANGMGAATCRLFAREGCKVAIADRVENEGRQMESEIRSAGGDAIFVHLDVTSEEGWQQVVEQVVDHYGRLNILVNFAGISSSIYPDHTSTEAWDHYMAVNAKGPFLGAKYAVPKMKEVGGGSIVNVSSRLGLSGSETGNPGYHTSKAALRLFTKSTAARYGPDNIRANSIHPGRMPPMTTGEPTSYWSQHEEALKRIPLRRAGTREEAAWVALFLASDEASYITGVELPVDGGLEVL